MLCCSKRLILGVLLAVNVSILPAQETSESGTEKTGTSAPGVNQLASRAEVASIYPQSTALTLYTYPVEKIYVPPVYGTYPNGGPSISDSYFFKVKVADTYIYQSRFGSYSIDGKPRQYLSYISGYGELGLENTGEVIIWETGLPNGTHNVKFFNSVGASVTSSFQGGSSIKGYVRVTPAGDIWSPDPRNPTFNEGRVSIFVAGPWSPYIIYWSVFINEIPKQVDWTSNFIDSVTGLQGKTNVYSDIIIPLGGKIVVEGRDGFGNIQASAEMTRP